MTQDAPVTNYATLLERVIDDGLTEVRQVYADPKDHHKRDGAIEGFEACRGVTTLTELVALWGAAEDASTKIRHEGIATGNTLAYWRQRYKALQIEWVCNVVSVGLVNNGQPPLLAHLPTARAAMKYAALVGTR